jgi:predicted DNA-binding transcriptional regulator AlpA
MRSRETADYIGISGSTLAKGRMTGNSPPYTKIGRIVVYDRNDIDEWLASRRRRSTSDEQNG